MKLGRRGFLKSFGRTLSGSLLVRNRSWSLLEDAAARVAEDPNRPSYHLLPPHNWMNDPNGPIWWKSQYHLFYQLNPHAAVWGDMHWGHATSADMIHWRHEPIALAPNPGGPDSEGCFSGSAVVYDGQPTIIYTGVQNAPANMVTIHDGSDKLRETQLLATADDNNLLRWNKAGAPIIAFPPPGMTVTGFRDPCLWPEGDTWYLGVGSGERGKGGCVLLYRSQDLRRWEYLHKLAEGVPNGKQSVNPCDSGEMWECPDFFELGKRHCLLYSTEGKVIWTIGDYDAARHTYTPARNGVLDHGAYYAPKSFLAPDQRRILWGWIRETRPEAEFASAGWAGVMSLPRVLTLGEQGQLEIRPAAEVAKLRGTAEKATVQAGTPFRRRLADLRQELRVPIDLSMGTITVRLLTNGSEVWHLVVNVRGDSIRCGDISFPLPSFPFPLPGLRVFLDGSVIETFIGGREVITSRSYSLAPGETDIEVSMAGKGRIVVDLCQLQAISIDRLAT
jgi:beta-fructofuranosidase